MFRLSYLIILTCFLFPAIVRSQQSAVSLQARALVTQNYCINPEQFSEAYYFRPRIGGNGEVMVRYRPDSSRFFFETGIGAWLWSYRVGLDSRVTTPAMYSNWGHGLSGLSLAIPLRAGYVIDDILDISAGVILLRNLSGGNSSAGSFGYINRGVEIDATSNSEGRSYNSIAFDLSFSINISRRFSVLLRGALDTKPYPGTRMEHSVTFNGTTRRYRFDGAPELAFFGVGAGFRF